MKKWFGMLILLSVIGLVACKDSSSEANDDCLDDPSLCSTTETDPELEVDTDF